MNQNKKTYAIILAGGVGSRMGASVPKQELCLLGKSILAHTIEAFVRAQTIDGIVVVVRAGEEQYARALLSSSLKHILVVTGGEVRSESARRGVLAADADFVAIHDAARPLIHPDDIDRVVRTAWQTGAASAVSRVYDTVKEIGKEGEILRTVDRNTLCLASTPQIFQRTLYLEAFSRVGEASAALTDDNMLLEKIGKSVSGVLLKYSNPKITTADDLLLAEFLLERRSI